MKKSQGKKRALQKQPKQTFRARPPIERIMRIHVLLAAGEHMNSTRLCREFEISRKTVAADVDFMKDRLNLPIHYDRERHTYFYTEKNVQFPGSATEGEIMALVISSCAMPHLRGTPFEKPLFNAMKKLCESLPHAVSFDPAEWQKIMTFQLSAQPIINAATLSALGEAANDRKQLEIWYRKPGQDEVERRIVDPYLIANINGEWFLIAYDHLRNDIRTFAPARIKKYEETGKTFVRSPDFCLEKHLKGSFGIFTGKQEHDVIIRFRRKVADFIREKNWGGQEALIDLPCGGVELHLRLTSLVEVERWIIGWGGNARVIAPIELKRSVRCAAQQILADDLLDN